MSTAILISTLAANLDYISRTKQHEVECRVGRLRPWGQVLHLHALSRPSSLTECFVRLRGNASYFRVNMAMAVLLGVFLSLVYHPVSLIVFVVAMGAWVPLFFLADHPLVMLGRPLDDRLVLALLAILTLLFLLLTSATINVVLSLAVSMAIVLLYSVFRRTDDLFLDESAASFAGFLSRPPQLHSSLVV